MHKCINFIDFWSCTEFLFKYFCKIHANHSCKIEKTYRDFKTSTACNHIWKGERSAQLLIYVLHIWILLSLHYFLFSFYYSIPTWILLRMSWTPVFPKHQHLWLITIIFIDMLNAHPYEKLIVVTIAGTHTNHIILFIPSNDWWIEIMAISFMSSRLGCCCTESLHEQFHSCYFDHNDVILMLNLFKHYSWRPKVMDNNSLSVNFSKPLVCSK